MDVRKAFEEAYLAHKDRLLTLALALTGDRNTAEDVVHDVFASLIKETRRLHHRNSLFAFLAVCARNRAYDLYRKTKRENLRPVKIPTLQRDEARDDPGEQLAQSEEKEALLGLVSGLPQGLREVLSLRIWGDLTFEEIARLQKTTRSTAHARYRQALEKLRIEFAKRG